MADRAENRLDRIGYLLSGANLLLARELEPICSRMVMRIPSAGEAEESAAAHDIIRHAEEWLGRAAELLKEAASPDAPSDAALDRAKRQHELLKAFCDALRAYVIPEPSEDLAANSARQAASRLSVCLEDADLRISASASLWNALLRGRDSDPARVISLLDPPLADPPEAALPYAFFARLYRCRLTAAQGGFPAALGLLIQMEDRCEEWFKEDGARADALRAVAWTQMQIAKDWWDKLADPSEDAARKWCEQRIAALTQDRFASEPRTVLRLQWAIPIIAEPPPAPPAPPASPEQPQEAGPPSGNPPEGP